MKTALKIIRCLLAIIGALLVYGAIGTSDYYAEIGQPEPLCVAKYIIIGGMMMLPMFLNALYNSYKENEQR